MSQSLTNLAALFHNTAAIYPQYPAIYLPGRAVTYAELARKALRLARILSSSIGQGACAAIFSDKSLSSYASVLGTLYSRNTYVPLSPIYPAARSLAILEASKAKAFVYQRSGSAVLRAILTALPPGIRAIEIGAIEFAPAEGGMGYLAVPPLPPEAALEPSEPAYIMFTSGSTGKPKGVPISHSNVLHYINVIGKEFDFTDKDRFTQNFELTFDLSIFDLFVPWRHGAAFCIPSALDAASPHQYLARHNITVWFSVPSAIRILQHNGLLKPGNFPSLRLSLFCGEVLTWDAARAWSLAASNSSLANLYGPTELTVSCFAYKLPSPLPAPQNDKPIVPIGTIHPGHDYLVVNENGRGVDPGLEGELCITGHQKFQGYLDDPGKSEARYLLRAEANGSIQVFYRTGDLVVEDSNGLIHYIGRIDHQVKVNGYRVELEEIEWAIRNIPGDLDAVVHFTRDSVAPCHQKLVAFIAGKQQDDDEILRQLKQTLPHYMLPEVIVWVGACFPLNGNGKVDVNLLMASLSCGCSLLTEPRCTPA